MGKSSSQVVGYRYYAKFAAFIGNRIEKFLGINFDNRGWILHDPTKHPPNLLPVQKPNLYGETEGGVSGNIDIHFGTPDQEPNAEYQKYFPLVSGYPYQSYLVFRGEGGLDFSGVGGIYEEVANILGAGGKSAFYVGNSGYMKEMLLWVKRTRVRNDGREQWYKVRGDGAVVCEIGDLSSGYGQAKAGFGSADWRMYCSDDFGEQLLCTASGDYSDSFVIEDLSKPKDHIFTFELKINGMVETRRYSGGVHLGGKIYKGGNSSGDGDSSSTNFNIYRMRIVDKLNPVIEYDSYFLNYGSTDYSIKELDEYLTISVPNHSRIQLIASSVDGVMVRGDQYINIELVGGDRDVDAIDINPIHKIREILTDDTAMAKPEADVNDQNFKKAADRIWDEGLGISWAIDEKSCIEAIEELCYHIEAGIRVNRQTGLYEMVLFRDDWFSEEEIHTIAENKIKDLSLEVMNSDDIVNQLNVTYYDRERIKNSTFSVYENGSILTMGHANAESVEFPYFMNMRNAEIVANWKLKQFSTPAWSGSFSTGWREARKWNRYDLIRLPWSSKWSGTILVRIMKINLGNGTDNTVTIDFEEVIPYSGEMSTSIVVDESMNTVAQPPQPSINAVFEAPYYLTVLRAGQTNADLELFNNPDIGYVAAIAAKPQSNSLNALLYTDGGVGEFEQVSRLDYCDILQLDQPITEITSSFVVTGSLTQTANSNNLILLNDELMGFVGFDDETKVLTVKRGVLDAVPKKHSSGSLFIFDLPDVAFDSTQYAQSEIVEAQVLTTTPSGIQGLSATGVPAEIQSRAIRPYPPANVKINGEYFPVEIETDLVIAWVDRNRVQQTGGETLGWFDAGVAIEPGTQTHLILMQLDENNLELATTNANVSSTTSYTMPISLMQADTRFVKITLKTTRDGFGCLNPFIHMVELSQFFSAPYDLTVEFKND